MVRIWIDGKHNVLADAGSRAPWEHAVSQHLPVPSKPIRDFIIKLFGNRTILDEEVAEQRMKMGKKPWSGYEFPELSGPQPSGTTTYTIDDDFDTLSQSLGGCSDALESRSDVESRGTSSKSRAQKRTHQHHAAAGSKYTAGSCGDKHLKTDQSTEVKPDHELSPEEEEQIELAGDDEIDFSIKTVTSPQSYLTMARLRYSDGDDRQTMGRVLEQSFRGLVYFGTCYFVWFWKFVQAEQFLLKP